MRATGRLGLRQPSEATESTPPGKTELVPLLFGASRGGRIPHLLAIRSYFMMFVPRPIVGLSVAMALLTTACSSGTTNPSPPADAGTAPGSGPGTVPATGKDSG